MEDIQFIPKKQKNIYSDINKNNFIIYFLLFLFISYILSIGFVYWFFLIREQSRVDSLISELDSKNSSYYPKGFELEQSLNNLNYIINNSYNPIQIINSIESSYLSNSSVSNFVYSKSNKTISISMKVSSIEDVSNQVQKFSLIQGVANVDFNSIDSTKSNTVVSFVAEIRLK